MKSRLLTHTWKDNNNPKIVFIWHILNLVIEEIIVATGHGHGKENELLQTVR